MSITRVQTTGIAHEDALIPHKRIALMHEYLSLFPRSPPWVNPSLSRQFQVWEAGYEKRQEIELEKLKQTVINTIEKVQVGANQILNKERKQALKEVLFEMLQSQNIKKTADLNIDVLESVITEMLVTAFPQEVEFALQVCESEEEMQYLLEEEE